MSSRTTTILKIIGDVFPVFIDWLKSVFDTTDEEFEKISAAWPYPTKTKLARLRAEQHARERFGVNADSPRPPR